MNYASHIGHARIRGGFIAYGYLRPLPHITTAARPAPFGMTTQSADSLEEALEGVARRLDYMASGADKRAPCQPVRVSHLTGRAFAFESPRQSEGAAL